jgi:3-deoxy-D-manno-octulosonate 8-phosphate phosphatase (KDO 8-P phosphatase)
MVGDKKTFLLDVDGVLTTGKFLYSIEGKIYKEFGPHDHDGLKLLKNLINIKFITCDKIGFEISKKRITEDMGFDLVQTSEDLKYEYITNNFKEKNLIYMGDGISDVDPAKYATYSIAPNNARSEMLEVVNYITESKSAEGAVLDACQHIIKLKLYE